MISRSRRRPRPTPATGRRTASVLCGPIARRQSPPRDRLLSRASGYPDQPASGQVRAGRNQFRCSPRKAQGAALAALAANGPTAGPCFKRPYLAAVKFLAESRRGRVAEVLAGSASSRSRRIRFVRGRGGAESMESLRAIFFFVSFGFRARGADCRRAHPVLFGSRRARRRCLNRAPTLCPPSNVAKQSSCRRPQ